MNKVPTIDEMRLLVNAGLATEKKQIQEGFENEFSVFKYNKKVFYRNLWNESEFLLESRGIVFDNNGHLVQLPLKKVFNFGENGTKVELTRKVIGAKKINGFMLAVTKYNGELFFSTTGSIKSDFVSLGKSVLLGMAKLELKNFFDGDYTYVFEICDPTDPHIVDEEMGAYLLGIRDKNNGKMVNPSIVKAAAQAIGVHCAEFNVNSFGLFAESLKEVSHEGYMIYDRETFEPLVKLKSPHYLSKKAIMRLGNAKVGMMFGDPEGFKKRLDEEFSGVLDHILWGFTADEWRDCDAQRRRQVIETYFMKEAYGA